MVAIGYQRQKEECDDNLATKEQQDADVLLVLSSRGSRIFLLPLSWYKVGPGLVYREAYCVL